MYSFEGRVRYSEVDSGRKLTIAALTDYLQDCCTFQSEEMGVGIDYSVGTHCAWILSSWEIVIEDRPGLMEELSVMTWPYGFSGFYGSRNFLVKDSSGRKRAFANSLWVYMDMETMRPKKIPEELADAYRDTFEPAIDYGWSDRKIKVAGEWERREPVAVHSFFIDTNRHMNNGKYILVAEEYLPEGFEVYKVRAEYRRAARLSDKLYPAVCAQEGVCTVSLNDDAGKPYAVVQFILRQEGREASC